ncbi:hypothetical protein C0073_022750 (plasmid) [Aeromonas veronii]|nr:hypothetical protein C0073_022750 [Aeromonas veronii]
MLVLDKLNRAVELHADQVGYLLIVLGLRLVAVHLMNVQAVELVDALLEVLAVFTRDVELNQI